MMRRHHRRHRRRRQRDMSKPDVRLCLVHRRKVCGNAIGLVNDLINSAGNILMLVFFPFFLCVKHCQLLENIHEFGDLIFFNHIIGFASNRIPFDCYASFATNDCIIFLFLLFVRRGHRDERLFLCQQSRTGRNSL